MLVIQEVFLGKIAKPRERRTGYIKFQEYFAVTKTVTVIQTKYPGVKKKKGNSNGNGNAESAHNYAFSTRNKRERKVMQIKLISENKNGNGNGNGNSNQKFWLTNIKRTAMNLAAMENWKKIGTEKKKKHDSQKRDRTLHFFSARKSGHFLHTLGQFLTNLHRNPGEKRKNQSIHVKKTKKNAVEAAPRNCRLLSLVVVECVLTNIPVKTDDVQVSLSDKEGKRAINLSNFVKFCQIWSFMLGQSAASKFIFRRTVLGSSHTPCYQRDLLIFC